MIGKHVPVHVWFLQSCGLGVTGQNSQHFLGDFSTPGTVLGLGAQRWKKPSPTFVVPFPSSLASDVVFLLSMYIVSHLAMTDIQDSSVCQFETNSTFPQNSVWELVSLVKITLPLNSLLGKTPNCLYFTYHYTVYAFSLSLIRIMSHFPSLPCSLNPTLFSFPPSLFLSPLPFLSTDVRGFSLTKWCSLVYTGAHRRVLISGFSPLIANLSKRTSPFLPRRNFSLLII